jgi:flagellar protein FlaG
MEISGISRINSNISGENYFDVHRADAGRNCTLEGGSRAGPEAKQANHGARARNGGETTRRVAEAMDRYVRSMQNELEIKVDDESGKIVVKVISNDTGEVIREIPSEEMLKLAAKMEEMAGLLLRATA